MTDDDLDLLLRESSHAVRPTLRPPAEVRRSAERRRRNRRLTAGAVAAAVVALALGSGLVASRDTSTTPRPLAPTDRLPALAADPFLTQEDWPLVRTDAVPASLSPCLSNPLTWGRPPPWARDSSILVTRCPSTTSTCFATTMWSRRTVRSWRCGESSIAVRFRRRWSLTP